MNDDDDNRTKTSNTSLSSSLLMLIIDLHPLTFTDKNEFQHIFENIIIFMKSFFMLNNENRIVFIMYHPLQCSILYPDTATGLKRSNADGNQIRKHLQERISTFLDETNDSNYTSHIGTNLSNALSLALCFGNRVMMAQKYVLPRVLIINGCKDPIDEYTATMNVAFSAQKLSIPIDVCMLNEESLLLQQASHLTNGVYANILKNELLQSLITIFLPDLECRKDLCLPQHDMVDYRATCFCHNNVVDRGVICPSCLSIFCKPGLQCQVCDTRFPRSLPPPPPTAHVMTNGDGVKKRRKITST